MHQAHFLIATALLEAGTGLLLVTAPSVPLALLLGIGSAAPETLLVSRISGAALVAIGIACWRAQTDLQGAAVTGLLSGALIYDLAASVLLTYASLILKMSGIAIWPAIILHAALAVWCGISLWAGPPQFARST
jgi:hypothetical protein